LISKQLVRIVRSKQFVGVRLQALKKWGIFGGTKLWKGGVSPKSPFWSL
jgi:hypothetical protein